MILESIMLSPLSKATSEISAYLLMFGILMVFGVLAYVISIVYQAVRKIVKSE